MPQYTENLNLTKLQDNEYYDGNVENENLDKIDQALGERVEKVEGKGLSTEDFTQTLLDKLNGIESGANVNLTASELLALLKTVDGSGSGLDADLLDGYPTSLSTDAYSVAVRNSTGDLAANAFRVEATISNTDVDRIATKADGNSRILFSTPAEFIAALGLYNTGNYSNLVLNTGNVTLTTGTHRNTVIRQGSAGNITIPANQFTAGNTIPVYKDTAGEVTFVAGSGLTIIQTDRSIDEGMVIVLFLSSTRVALIGSLK